MQAFSKRCYKDKAIISFKLLKMRGNTEKSHHTHIHTHMHTHTNTHSLPLPPLPDNTPLSPPGPKLDDHNAAQKTIQCQKLWQQTKTGINTHKHTARGVWTNTAAWSQYLGTEGLQWCTAAVCVVCACGVCESESVSVCVCVCAVLQQLWFPVFVVNRSFSSLLPDINSLLHPTVTLACFLDLTPPTSWTHPPSIHTFTLYFLGHIAKFIYLLLRNCCNTIRPIQMCKDNNKGFNVSMQAWTESSLSISWGAEGWESAVLEACGCFHPQKDLCNPLLMTAHAQNFPLNGSCL